MKTLLLALLVLPVLAQAEPLLDPCADISCTEKMATIGKDYMGAKGLQLSEPPAVYSGECFHNSQDLNPEVTHHAYILIDHQDSSAYMPGMFSFFRDSNPYSDLTVERARELNPNRFEDRFRLDLQPDYAFADMNRNGSPSNPRKFWLKRSSDTLLLIGQWGYFHRVFCRLQKNQ